MALEKAFQDLCDRLCELEENLEHFGHAVNESKPAGKDHHLAGRLWEAVAEMQGLCGKGRAAAEEARKAVDLPVRLEVAWRKLRDCQQSMNDLSRQFPSLPGSDKDADQLIRVTDLMTLRCEHPLWAGWVDTQFDHLRDVCNSAREANESVLPCWVGIAERRVVANSASVQATNIGQQITVPEFASKGLRRKGVT